MDDAEFRRAFDERKLAGFRHRDHVRLAFICLREDPSLRGLDGFVRALQAFAAHAGRPELYHETLTWAFLLILRERMEQGTAANFDEFADANPDLLAWQPSVLDRYYRPETLSSPRARRVFVMPDRGIGPPSPDAVPVPGRVGPSRQLPRAP
jgi:hypothetical protein